jgi:hypothetical protein
MQSAVPLDASSVAPWTDHEIRSTVEAYGLGKVTGPPTATAELGWDQQRARVIVQTTSGDWFLKKHHPAAYRNEQHSLVRAFVSRGGRAPEIASLPDGSTWLQAGDAMVEAQRVVDGSVLLQPTNDLAKQAVEQLATWHTTPVEDVPESWTGWYEPTDAESLGIAVLERLTTFGLPTRDIDQLIGEEVELAALPSVGKTVALHGDLWRGNWLVNGGAVAALTDFDWIHRGSRLDDLADLVHAFASGRDLPYHKPGISRPVCPVHIGRGAAIITMYENYFGPLDANERIAFTCRLRSHWLRHHLWILRRASDRVHLETILKTTLDFCAWTRNGVDRIIRAGSKRQ